jgi:hypothetical protein
MQQQVSAADAPEGQSQGLTIVNPFANLDFKHNSPSKK